MDLVDPLRRSDALAAIPRLPGVYLWRRSLELGLETVRDFERCSEWLQGVVANPQLRVTQRRITPHLLLEGLSIGGGELTPDKARLLEQLVRGPRSRRFVCSAVVSLESFLPPLYVGRADDLRARVRDHLDGQTGLVDYLRSVLELDWEDVSLWFLAVRASARREERGRAIIELLEYVAQKVLAPFAVERCG
ncbi:MAG: GIY-YIG nuclease family protein [Candidatus Dadabacteria bacterium]|nr:MAG: GIY-YIG nuclease family protein [Candidatus Dadabacteria bacterium]